MIAYLRGKVLRRLEGTLVVECGGVGYEVHLPGFVRDAIGGNARTEGDAVELYISYHVSANQPRPILVGFLRGVEQEFFESFITVDGVGPTKAIRAINQPIETIADAIERKDIAFLRRLPGIGERTAEKIVAALRGKVAKYALLRSEPPAPQRGVQVDFRDEVIEVLTGQLGHRAVEARQMVERALQRNPGIASAEELFQEVYRSERGALA